MDGPAEVSQLRAPKRPYPEEEEETQEVRFTHTFTCYPSNLWYIVEISLRNVKKPNKLNFGGAHSMRKNTETMYFVDLIATVLSLILCWAGHGYWPSTLHHVFRIHHFTRLHLSYTVYLSITVMFCYRLQN